MSKLNARLSVVRPALLGAALLLNLAAMTAPAIAACTPGATRTITVNPVCCGGGVRVTKQNQKCNSSGVWANSGGTYCAPASVCAI
ncbi:MAG TPA: hypothetical protein VG477_14080 [Thermoanaerobaculia bacterium]|nr:hypothetical protein [Thermoanaerobaculia bacterium]